MTSITYIPNRDCVNSLGIPVDNLTLDDAVSRITAMAKCRDGRARLVSTLNVDFLVNSLGTGLRRPRHPELLDVLRTSDLVTADGFPIVWLSRMLGKPLQARVCGSDMVPALARSAAREGLSLFLFGGADGVASAAAKCLQSANPGLRIAGTESPQVRTAGPGLAEVANDDQAVLETINNSGADILLVGLGNPKQELWFNRNRARLRVPVAIGVGGTFEFITGGVRRAPPWVRAANLEWLYRIAQDPLRLWKRYAKGLVKLSALSAPILLARLAESLHPRRRSTRDVAWHTLWSSRERSISVLRLPRYVDQDYLQLLAATLANGGAPASMKILDFSAVRHIELAALQEFFNLSALIRKHAANTHVMGLTRRLVSKLTTARVFDLLGNTGGSMLGSIFDNSGQQQFRCESYVIGNTVLAMLGGRVDADSLSAMGFVECMLNGSRDRRCVIDFRGVSLLESSGIAELLPLLQQQANSGDRILLSGSGHGVRQMFRMAEIPVTSFISDAQLLQIMTAEAGSDD